MEDKAYYQFTIHLLGFAPYPSALILAESEAQARQYLGTLPKGATATFERKIPRSKHTGSLDAASHAY